MKVKEVCKKIGSNFWSFQFGALNKLDKKYSNDFMKLCCYSYENISENFISFRKRPKFSKNIIINNNILSKENEKCAIVIQGPIIMENEFSFETVKLYKLMYPNAVIIVSTWDDVEKSIVNSLKKEGIIVLTNKKPKVSGLGNINYQIISTVNGIKEAKKLGVKYILKIRSDQRIYKPNFLEYFMGLIEVFPSNSKEYGIEQKSRIITMQGTVGGSMFMPFFIADFLFFGHIEDIEKLFSLPQNDINHKSRIDRVKYSSEFKTKSTIYEYYKKMAPEIIIIRNYIDKYSKREYKETVEEYWDFVKKCLICVSWDDLGVYWNKYNKYEENINFHTYESDDNYDRYLLYNWTFNNWLSLYSGKITYNETFELYKNKSANIIL